MCLCCVCVQDVQSFLLRFFKSRVCNELGLMLKRLFVCLPRVRSLLFVTCVLNVFTVCVPYPFVDEQCLAVFLLLLQRDTFVAVYIYAKTNSHLFSHSCFCGFVFAFCHRFLGVSVIDFVFFAVIDFVLCFFCCHGLFVFFAVIDFLF